MNDGVSPSPLCRWVKSFIFSYLYPRHPYRNLLKTKELICKVLINKELRGVFSDFSALGPAGRFSPGYEHIANKGNYLQLRSGFFRPLKRATVAVRGTVSHGLRRGATILRPRCGLRDSAAYFR